MVVVGGCCFCFFIENAWSVEYAFSKHFEVVLNTGSYTVTKELTLSSDAQVAFRNKFLQTDTCKRLVDFYSQELGVLQATSNCAVTCTSCKAALGDSLNGFIKKFANEMSLNVDSLSNETIIQLKDQYVAIDLYKKKVK